jgi:hypothetical protein
VFQSRSRSPSPFETFTAAARQQGDTTKTRSPMFLQTWPAWFKSRACYGRSESTIHPVPVRSEPLSAFEPSEATGALDHSYVRGLENTGSIPHI